MKRVSLLIAIIVVAYTLYDTRKGRIARFEVMRFSYNLSAGFGYWAWRNPYPIDYRYGRREILPHSLMLQFNHICYHRIIRGDTSYHASEMKSLVSTIHRYLIRSNAPLGEAGQLEVLYPFQKEADAERLQYLVRRRHPFVIRGRSWKTCTRTIKELIDRYGETIVMFEASNGITFRDRLSTIYTHQAYLSNSTSFIKKHPEVVDPDDKACLHKLSGLSFLAAQVFLSLLPNNGTPMHSAFSHNFFFMAKGSKKWTFWHPDYLSLVYPFFPRHGVYMASYTGVRDLSRDDISNYPLLRYAPRLEIALQEGDVLFNPGPWWHSIRNLTRETLGFATRWMYPDLFPSRNMLQYCQLQNSVLVQTFRDIFANTGSLNFDVDENNRDNADRDTIALIEILNHDALHLLRDKDRHRMWHPR